jgi:subtilase family serine protease
MVHFIVLLLLTIVNVTASNTDLYVGPFQSGHWVPDTTEASRDPAAFHVQQHEQLPVKFIVALKHRDINALKKELLDVSMPSSHKYGKHLSVSDIRSKFCPTQREFDGVLNYFSSIPGAYVESNKIGSMLQVTAPLQAVEQHLMTKLAWFRHTEEDTPKRSLRAIQSLNIPSELQNVISFISLNSPISHNVKPKRVKSKVAHNMKDLLNDHKEPEKKSEFKTKFNAKNVPQNIPKNVRSMRDSDAESAEASSSGQRHVYVTEGNREVTQNIPKKKLIVS